MLLFKRNMKEVDDDKKMKPLTDFLENIFISILIFFYVKLI